MPDTTLDNRTLIRRALVFAGVMVSAGAVVVGTLTLVASAVTDRIVAPPGEAADDAGSPVSIHHPVPGARPSPGPGQTAK